MKRRLFSIMAVSLLTLTLNSIALVSADDPQSTAPNLSGPLSPASTAPAGVPTSPDQFRADGERPRYQPTIDQFESKGLLSNLGPKCKDEGKCSICDMVQVGVNVGNLILAISGAVALFFGAWAAFGFITARGDDEKVKEARTTMWNALAGIILVLLAWQLVAIILVVLTGNPNPFKGVCGL